MDKTIPGSVIGCLIALAVMVGIAVTGRAQNADINLLKDINLQRNKNLDGGMVAITHSVYPFASAVPIIELASGYLKHDSALMRTGLVTAAATGLNFAVEFGLKYAFNRNRPYITYPTLDPYKQVNDPSFPSGHTSFAFNTATSLALNCRKWYVIVPAYTWAASVGWSRMALGMHYPSDVLAGAIVGTGTSYLVYRGNKWLQHRKTKKNHTLEH